MLSKGWSGEVLCLRGKKGAGMGSEHCGKKEAGICSHCGLLGGSFFPRESLVLLSGMRTFHLGSRMVPLQLAKAVGLCSLWINSSPGGLAAANAGVSLGTWSPKCKVE